MASGKSLSVLAADVAAEIHDRGRDISKVLVTDVTHDSRMVAPGSLFVAITGAAHDGHDYVEAAVRGGAAALCVEHEVDSAIPEIVVASTRGALAALAASVHGNPSHSVPVIGVTGTNGKTTVTHYIESIGRSVGRSVGLIGTLGTRIAGEHLETAHTTPEASDFQRLLAMMRDRAVDYVTAEVSSHALALSRVASTRFAVAAFTNLSQDHLDFHHTMDSYGAVKRSLFTDYEVGQAVVNIDDEAGAALASGLPGDVLTVGSSGEVRIEQWRQEAGGTRVSLATPWGGVEALAPLFGAFNVSNLAVAAACSLVVGIEPDEISKAIPELVAVPGRFEIVSGKDPVTVIVDYAHTPAGIENAIETARAMSQGRVVAVVGAGGDRDREKRPRMGRAASTADLVVITTDNPRSEEPRLIAEDVAAGVPAGSFCRVELDRAAAIEHAITAAGDGDVVLVLGRGHEPFQEVDGQYLPMDDRDLARSALARHRQYTESGQSSGSMTA